MVKENKVSLNVKKIELIIFHTKNTKLDYGVKFKLHGRRLTPISTVKYLGILLDEYLVWTKQVNWVNSKVNQTIGIRSKLRYNTSLPILKIVYHSLFGSHLQHGAQLWGQGNCVDQNNIQNLQNRAFSKIVFKNFYDPVNPLYKELKIPKFKDFLHFQDCLLVLQIEPNQTLRKSFITLNHCGDNHNYETLASTKRLLDTPLHRTRPNRFFQHQDSYFII